MCQRPTVPVWPAVRGQSVEVGASGVQRIVRLTQVRVAKLAGISPETLR